MNELLAFLWLLSGFAAIVGFTLVLTKLQKEMKEEGEKVVLDLTHDMPGTVAAAWLLGTLLGLVTMVAFLAFYGLYRRSLLKR